MPTSLPKRRNLSKSRYCSGLQCLRRLWWEVHEPQAPELLPDPSLATVFARGHRVGELARERFEGGTLVDFEPYQVTERVAATAEALRRGARVVFEASFAAGGAFAALDVLERRRRGFALVEVKATLDVKPQFLPDVGLQVYAARSAGVDVRRAELMHLNRECTYPRLEDLFVRDDVTAEVEPLVREVPRNLRRMRAALDGPVPEVEPGEHCDDPYPCPFAARCLPELRRHHVTTLHRIPRKRAGALLEAGYETLHDLPDDAEELRGLGLSGAALRQVHAVKKRRLVVEPGLGDTLRALEAPIAFLDFESVNPPVPAWDGCRPYQHVPVQVSCHVVGPRGGLVHREHLAEPGGDPRPALADAVLRACEGARTVVAYHAPFERKCLDHLACAVPRLARRLGAIRERVVDLLPIVQEHVYHPAFDGSFSLKAVAPALVPDLGYGDLAVADGSTASALLEALLLEPASVPGEARPKLRQDLLAYCARDTLALVRVHERLGELAAGR